MESIISPWFVYLLSLVDNLGVFFCTFASIIGTALTIYIIGKIVTEVNGYNVDDWKLGWKKVKVGTLIVIFWVFLILGMFLPTRNTLIAMYVADKMTYAKVEKVVKITEDIKGQLKKDVMDIIGAIKKGTIKEEEDIK